MELVEIWKQKDECLQKFQSLCKFRIIQLIMDKMAYENSPIGKKYEDEMKQLDEQIKQEKILQEKRKKEE